MAVFTSSSIVSGSSQNDATLITMLDGLGVGQGIAKASGALSTTSGSDVSLQSTSATMVSDEIGLMLFECQYSLSNTDTIVEFTPYINGSALTDQPHNGHCALTSTSGNRQSVTLWAYNYDMSGSITFEVKFKRTVGTGTIYIGYRSIAIFRMKRKT